jgi:hypothetical protein
MEVLRWIFRCIIQINSTNIMNKDRNSTITDPTKLIGPHGFLQCTCEKYPKITHINAQMQEYLGVTEENSNWKDFLMDNIFFMIPFDERDIFRMQLEKALHSDKPINIRHELLRSDGSRIPLNGWLSVVESNSGEREYAFVYFQMETNPNEAFTVRENSYFRALQNAYHVIFEINFTKNTVECIHGRETSNIGALYDVHMTLESARNFWLNNYVLEEDRPMMEEFLTKCTTFVGDDHPPMFQTDFHLRWTNNVINHYLGVAVYLDSTTLLLCIRNLSRINYSGVSHKEYNTLYMLHTWIDMEIEKKQSSFGTILISESDGRYALFYISRKIRRYLNLPKDEYLAYICGESSFEQFLEAVNFPVASFKELLDSKEIQHTISLPDHDPETVIMSCARREFENKKLYEITLYHKDAQNNQDVTPNGIFARTFGHFDLFVNGRPVTFSNTKEKELMALLIDRNGGTLSTHEAISYLWEGEEANERVSSRYRKLGMSLKNTLEKYGIGHILINHHGVRSIDVSAITCDYYELLAGNKKYRSMFHNSYMSDYSWAEETLGTLWDYS